MKMKLKEEMELLKQCADDWAKSNKKSIDVMSEAIKIHTKVHLRTLDMINKLLCEIEEHKQELRQNRNYVKKTYPILKATANKVLKNK